MSLRVALVIDGEPSGAKKALEETASGIEKLDSAAGSANPKVDVLGSGLGEIATEAGKAAVEVPKVGDAAETAGGKFAGFKEMALTAVAGIAGAFANAAIQTAVGLVTSAVGDMVENIVSSEPQVREALESHATLVRQIKAAYNEADGAASSYGNNSMALLQFQARQNVQQLGDADRRLQGEVLNGALLDQLGQFLNPFATGPAGLGMDMDTMTAGSPFHDLVWKFREDLAAGTADAIAFKNEVASIANALPADATADLDLAGRLIETVSGLAEVQQQLAAGRDVLTGLEGDASAMATAIGGAAEDYVVLGDNAGTAATGLDQAATGISATGDAASAAIGPLTTVNQLLGAIGAKQGVTPQSVAALPLTMPGYATGGPTTAGADHDVAGLVHANEYVFDAAATRRIGVRNLDAIRAGAFPGFAAGGYAGTSSSGSAAAGFSLRDAFDDLLSGLSGLGSAVRRFTDDVVQTGDPLNAFGNLLIQTGVSVLDSISNSFAQAAGSGLSAFLGDVVGNLFGGPKLKLGYNLPGFATGTNNFPGGWATINEQGGETVKLPSGTVIYPHDVSMAMAQSGNVTFAPVTHLSIGSNAGVSMADVQAALDARDEALHAQFNTKVADFLENPRRVA